MILTPANTKGKKVRIFDCRHNEIVGLSSFDTKTCKATIILFSAPDEKGKKHVVMEPISRTSTGLARKVKRVTTTIKGAYATINGKRVE